LDFDESGEPILDIPPLVELPVPMVFNLLPFGNLSKNVRLAMAEGARRIGTMMYLAAGDYDESLEAYKPCLIPVASTSGFDPSSAVFKGVKIVELAYAENALDCARQLKEKNPGVIVSFRVPMDSRAKAVATELAFAGAEMIHLYADFQGNEFDGNQPRFVKDVMRDIHGHLVTECVRDEVTLVMSGGIALAEHLPKALICGADGAAVDLPLLIALECRVCKRCAQGKSCPVEIESVDVSYGAQRIVNLMCSWWSQLIEVMGAMGIRDVRRVRGEAGRAMFFEDLERETFGAMFGKKK